MASSDLMLQREGVREGLCVRRACVVCVYLEGGRGEMQVKTREKKDQRNIYAYYILLRIIRSHLQDVYLVFCMLYLVYGCSSWVVCLPCLYYQFFLYTCKLDY